MKAKNTTCTSDRTEWLQHLLQIAMPVLTALAEGTLRQKMPVYAAEGVTDRSHCTYLEALGRTLLGVAPWLACRADGEEEVLRVQCACLCRRAIANAVDPDSPDFMNFSDGFQPLVDAAFLAQAILRAPQELYEKLDAKTRQNLLSCMRATRSIRPCASNWLLFSAIVEVFLRFAGQADWDSMRVDYALRQHLQWYKGDGAYGDGAYFHFDYYNSLVIHPMLCDCLRLAGDAFGDWQAQRELVFRRASRLAGVLEQLIHADGSYPVVGRSSCYRFGVFHALSQAALDGNLPDGCTPAQVRCALTAVIRRILSYETVFDADGFLQIGVCGRQPHMGEGYISTGSLYLCTAVFLPLGLPADDPFWADAACDWTAKKIWAGCDVYADRALQE